MVNLAKGVTLTLKSMGFNVLFREFLRRVLGIKYHYHGILIDSDVTFRIIRNILLKGYEINVSDNDIVVHTPFGELCVSVADVKLLTVLSEPLEDMYGFINVKDAIVVDIGAYIGETALLFLSKGARRVYALEPVSKHYCYLLNNISRNNVADRIIPLNYGAWFREAVFDIGYEEIGTGLKTVGNAFVTIKVKHLGYILREIFSKEGRIDLVKMDCEGCEYSLLSLPAEDIKLVKQYIIEIHGSESPIIDRMTECGYRHRLVRNMASLISLHYFTTSAQ